MFERCCGRGRPRSGVWATRPPIWITVRLALPNARAHWPGPQCASEYKHKVAAASSAVRSLSAALTVCSIYDRARTFAVADDQIPDVRVRLIMRFPSYAEPIQVRIVHRDPSPVVSHFDLERIQVPDGRGEGGILNGNFHPVGAANQVMGKHEVARRRDLSVILGTLALESSEFGIKKRKEQDRGDKHDHRQRRYDPWLSHKPLNSMSGPKSPGK